MGHTTSKNTKRFEDVQAGACVKCFWTLCQMWVLEISLEELSTLATEVRDSAYLQLE